MEDGSADGSSSDLDNSFGRQRSNSDPCCRDNKIVMNGKNTVPKSRAPSYLKATGQDEKTATVRTATPPPSRKNKFAASISRLFRPWKWRRKRKSERFIATSENLERQLSVRAKREELVKKGILPPSSGSFPEDDHANGNTVEGTQIGAQPSSEVDNLGRLAENPKPSAVCPQKEANLKGILKASPVPQRSVMATGELQIRQIDQMNMMEQLSQKLANRTSGSHTSQEATNADEQLVSYGGVRGQSNAQWTRVVNVHSLDNSCDANKENASPQVSSHHDDDSSDEEEEHGVITHLASKLKRTDSLALKLKARPSKVELEEKNILHAKSEVQAQEQRAEVGSKLVRRLSSRPTAQELRERNILKSSSEEQEKEEREEKKKVLTRKLSRRPTIQELKARKILKFSEYVESGECQDYDRRADKPWTRLTPEDKAAIRKELNEYKSVEMEVHEDSRQYTRFHRP